MKLPRLFALLAALLLGSSLVHGQDLGAGGGEPGKALLAHFDAIRGGDVEKLRGEMHPDNHAQLDEMIKSGEVDMVIGMMQAFTPDEVTITGGTVDGDSAELQFTGKMDGEAAKGSATLGKAGDRWLVKKVRMSN